MYILKMELKNHPILGNLSLDFTDCNGDPFDNIILAGENGCGKTTILDIISSMTHHHTLPVGTKLKFMLKFNDAEQKKIMANFIPELAQNRGPFNYTMYTIEQTDITTRHSQTIFYKDKLFQNICEPKTYNLNLPFSCLYLTPEITFNPKHINSITAKTTDEFSGGLLKSNADIATSITQLLIDIDNQDNTDFCQLYESAPSANYSTEQRKPRISRFNNAFKEIFDNMQIAKIENKNNRKQLLFSNFGNSVPVENLSTGEKQIIFRGGFLLQNSQSTPGSLVLIDEPEISLHPDWQKKISNFYKKIFTNTEGSQTSQIIMATHSPFVVHNKDRQNEKVIIFKRDTHGNIIVDDNPEYYSCDSKIAIAKAFNCIFETPTTPTVFLEGRTDELYFKKSMNVFGFDSTLFQFKWIGYIANNGQETNTGNDALNKAYQFLYAQGTSQKCILLYDNDTKRENISANNIYVRTIPFFESSKEIKKGIENALVLDNIDITPFYNTKTTKGDYGEQKIIQDFDKMGFCEYICSLPDEQLTTVFHNLKKEIEKIIYILETE